MPDAATSFAPGRVNLIGEHIDYHGLPVLPMALRRGVRVEFRPRGDDRVSLANRDPAFGTREFRVGADLKPGPAGDWGNYAMAAAVTVADRYGAARGLEGLISSDLPPAAGLSSSSALVVAVAIALLHVNRVRPDRLELAHLLAEGEKFVGTAGGGMDQAASLLGREGYAVRIDFEPLAAAPVPFPTDWRVLVAHTGVSAEKSGGAQQAYNLRRKESGLALHALAAAMGVPGVRPVELLDRFPQDDLLEALGGAADPGRRWASHAVTEAVRVTAAEGALRNRDLAAFGGLLDASHESLRDVYEVSHPRLDALVDAAKRAGAAGARLTGAGFGGCMLAVCAAEREEEVRIALARTQESMDPAPRLAPFPAEPGPGASISAAGEQESGALDRD